MEEAIRTLFEKGACPHARYFSKHVSKSVYCVKFLACLSRDFLVV